MMQMTPIPFYRRLLLALVCLAPAILVAQGPERFSGPSSQTLAQLTGDYWEWRLAVSPSSPRVSAAPITTIAGAIGRRPRATVCERSAKSSCRRRCTCRRATSIPPTW